MFSLIVCTLLLSPVLLARTAQERAEDKRERNEENREKRIKERADEDRPNQYATYIQQRREIMISMNHHVYAYCSQALFNICKPNSLPLIPEDGKVRRQVRFRNETYLHEYYAYVQGTCMARMEDACEKTEDKRPIEYETKREERKAARQWYFEDKKLRNELGKCTDNSCRDRVRKEIEKNNEEKTEEKLGNFLNKKHKACQEWEKMDRQHAVIDHLDEVLTQLNYPDAALLKFDLPVELERNIPGKISKIFCDDSLKDNEEKSGKKPKVGKNGKDDDDDDDKKKGKGKNKNKKESAKAKKNNGGGKNKGAISYGDDGLVVDVPQTTLAPNQVSVVFDNKYSYDAEFSREGDKEGDLAFANPSEEQKTELKALSDGIKELSDSIAKEKLSASCSQDSDCGVVQTQVNSCGGYNQTIVANQTEPAFGSLKTNVDKINDLSKKYILKKEEITNIKYCPSGYSPSSSTPSAACVDSICVAR